jgi:hypothetical protein
LVDIVEEEAAAGEVLAQALIEIALLFALLAHILGGIAFDQLLESSGSAVQVGRCAIRLKPARWW